MKQDKVNILPSLPDAAGTGASPAIGAPESVFDVIIIGAGIWAL